MFVASKSISGKASELFLFTIKRDSNRSNQISNKLKKKNLLTNSISSKKKEP